MSSNTKPSVNLVTKDVWHSPFASRAELAHKFAKAKA